MRVDDLGRALAIADRLELTKAARDVLADGGSALVVIHDADGNEYGALPDEGIKEIVLAGIVGRIAALGRELFELGVVNADYEPPPDRPAVGGAVQPPNQGTAVQGTAGRRP